MSDNFGIVMACIKKLGESELAAVNREVVAQINGLRRGRLAAAAAMFRLGERVYFLNRAQMKVEGVVAGINRSTVKVHVDRGALQPAQIWTVSSTLLTKIV